MNKKKMIVSSILSLAMCSSLVVGGTYALFTHESQTNIAVTSGKVEVKATINNLKTYSMDIEQEAGTFENSGTAEIVENEITLDRVTPGDKATFDIEVANNSNVNIKYRTVVSAVEGGSMNGLVVTINGESYTGASIANTWLTLGPADPIETIEVSVELPKEAGNVYQNLTTKFFVRVEAVQGNAEVSNDDNAPEEVAPGTLAELKQAFEDAAKGTGDMIISLTKDFDVAAQWESILPGAYNGVVDITVEGNHHTIYNLNVPLFRSSFAGEGTLTFKNLTIKDADINVSDYNGLGAGAFAGYSDNSGAIVMENCHLLNSKVTVAGYAGGLVGYSSSQSVSFTNCSVKNSQITGHKSAGGLIGHIGNTLSVVDCAVEGCTITENLENRDEAGAALIVGRMSGGSTAILTGTITVKGNTVNQGAAVTGVPANKYCANGAVDISATIVKE